MQPLYLDHAHAKDWYPLTQWVNETKIILRICPDRTSWRTCYLHWVRDYAKTLPCAGEKCKLCPSPRRIVTYCPCEVSKPATKTWARMVFVCNESMRPILDEDLLSGVFETCRRGKRNSPVTYSKLPPFRDCPAVLPFPLEPSLNRCWGIQLPNGIPQPPHERKVR